jgi:hypothetical protein
VLGSVLNIPSDRVELRCTLVDLAIHDGIVDTCSLVADTPVADIRARAGSISGPSGSSSRCATPDGTPMPTDLTGVSTGGALAHPAVNVNPAAVAVRGATAVAGALLKPFTATAGALGGEKTKPSPCTNVLQQRQTD